MDFVGTIQKVMKERNLKQSDIVRGAGIHAGNFSMLLSGKQECSIKTAEKICNYLNLELASVYM